MLKIKYVNSKTNTHVYDLSVNSYMLVVDIITSYTKIKLSPIHTSNLTGYNTNYHTVVAIFYVLPITKCVSILNRKLTCSSNKYCRMKEHRQILDMPHATSNRTREHF